MNEHSDCLTCAYWQSRIAEEKARTLARCEGAFDSEKHARAELAEHLSRETHSGAENRCEATSTFTGTCSPWPTRGERERWGSV
jgi:hypothetical protein